MESGQSLFELDGNKLIIHPLKAIIITCPTCNGKTTVQSLTFTFKDEEEVRKQLHSMESMRVEITCEDCGFKIVITLQIAPQSLQEIDDSIN